MEFEITELPGNVYKLRAPLVCTYSQYQKGYLKYYTIGRIQGLTIDFFIRDVMQARSEMIREFSRMLVKYLTPDLETLDQDAIILQAQLEALVYVDWVSIGAAKLDFETSKAYRRLYRQRIGAEDASGNFLRFCTEKELKEIERWVETDVVSMRMMRSATMNMYLPIWY